MNPVFGRAEMAMRKLLSCMLALFIAASALAQDQTAVTPPADDPTADVRALPGRAASHPDGVENSRAERQNTPASNPAVKGPDAVGYSVAGNLADRAQEQGNPQQSSPPSSRNPPAHSSHHLRNFLQAFAEVLGELCCVGILLLEVSDRNGSVRLERGAFMRIAIDWPGVGSPAVNQEADRPRMQIAIEPRQDSLRDDRGFRWAVERMPRDRFGKSHQDRCTEIGGVQ